jgi:hypothetical protein
MKNYDQIDQIAKYVLNKVCYVCVLDIITMMSSSFAINQIISIPPEELILPTLDGGTISIPIPSSHIGKKPIHVRLISSKRRIGMVNGIIIILFFHPVL